MVSEKENQRTQILKAKNFLRYYPLQTLYFTDEQTEM